MKYKSSLLIVPVILGVVNVNQIVHADNVKVNSNAMSKVQSFGELNIPKVPQATGTTYIAEQDDHAKIVGNPQLSINGGNKPTVGGNVSLGGITATGVGVDFTYKLKDIKKGDTIVFPFKNSGFTAGSYAGGDAPIFSFDSHIKNESLQGVGYGVNRGLIFKAIKDIPGEATGTVHIGEAVGNSVTNLARQLSDDGMKTSINTGKILYNDKLMATVKSDVDGTDPVGWDTFYNSDMSTVLSASVGKLNLAHYISSDSFSKNHIGSGAVLVSAHIKMKSNDSILSVITDDDHAFMSPVAADGSGILQPGGSFLNDKGTLLNDISQIDQSSPARPTIVKLANNLTREQVKAQLKAKGAGAFVGYSMSSDGREASTALWVSDASKYGAHVKDMKTFKESGKKTVYDYFKDIVGIPYTSDAKAKVDDYADNKILNSSYYMNFELANPAIDHDVEVTTSKSQKSGIEDTSGDKTTTVHTNGSTVVTKGQSQVQARYRDSTGKDISGAGDPVIGWPKGSDKNKDGADKGTVNGKVISGYILTKTPTGAKTTTPYSVTADFPVDGATTYEDYIYTPTAKYVTDEASVKDKLPKYANDTTDAKKIKTSYTIPYVKGKKAQGPDGKTLTLVDAKDRTKGYVAPKIADPTKDTKITYAADTVKMTVNYLDKSSNNKIVATEATPGINGEVSTYSTAKEIKFLEDKGYGLDKDNYPKGHVYNGNETFTVIVDEATTDHTSENPNGMDKSKLERDIKQTINYVANDGKNKKPLPDVKSNVQTVKFTNHIVTNNVTGAVVKEDGWKSSNNVFSEVKSPVVHAWKLAKDEDKSIPSSSVKADDKDSAKTVEYVKDVGDVTVNYIDTADHDKVITTQKANGINDEVSTYSTEIGINDLTKKGYRLIKDGYPKNHKYNGSEVFTVELDHATTTHTPDDPKGMDPDKLSKTVTETVNYWKRISDAKEDSKNNSENTDDKLDKLTSSEDDNSNSNSTNDDDHEGLEKVDGKEFDPKIQSVEFTKSITTDNTNGEITSETPFTSDKNKFEAVNSSELPGYTPDHIKIEGVDDVKPTDKDAVIDVVYNAGEQKVKVTYINDSEQDESKKVIKADGLTGKSDQQLDYSTKESIEKIEADGYKLKEDGYPKDGVTIDHDDKTDQNYEVHFEKVENELVNTGISSVFGKGLNAIYNLFK